MFKLTAGITGLSLVAGIFGGVVALEATAVILTLLACAGYVYLQMTVRVPEMHVAIVHNTQHQAFARFLPSGTHRITPFLEKIETIVSTAPATAKGVCKNAHTIGGLTVGVEWTMAYTLNPFKAPTDTHAKLALNLPKATQVAQKHVNNCLQHILDDYTIDQLCEPGAHKRLEREVRQMAAERLAGQGFEVTRVMIDSVELPAHVRTVLEAAHERQIQTENEAKALSRMQAVISQFSEADMQRLMELERIYKMGQNGVTLMYSPMSDPNQPQLSKTPYSKYTVATKQGVSTNLATALS